MSTYRATDFNPNTILFFDANQCVPSANELAILKRWLAGWRAQAKAKKLVIGGALDTPRAGRLRRLRVILNVLKDAGISMGCVQPVEDWFVPTRMGMTEVLPADMAWIGEIDGSDKPGSTTPPKAR